MKIDIYTSSKNAGKHLSVPSGTELEKVTFPPGLDADLKTVKPFKATVDLSTPGLVGLDASDIEHQINAKGFAVHSTSIEINVYDPNA